MLWLYLHFPCLQLDSLFVGDLSNQELNQEKNKALNKPTSENQRAVIIVDGRKSQVVQLNQQALAQGIKLGMGLGTAASLSAQLQVYPYQRDTEEKQLKQIAQWLYLITSDISFYQPDGILLRISNMLSLYKHLNDYWQHLQRHLKTLELHYHYATAYSPLAARLLARSAFDIISDDQALLLKKIKEQPLHASELQQKTIEKLERVGIRYFGDLLQQPLAQLAKRFDSELVTYLGRLTGQIQHPHDFYHPPEQFQCYLELLYEISNIDWLEKPLLKLFHQLEAFLKLRDRTTHQVDLRLHQREHEDIAVSITSAQGEYRAQKWLELSQLTLESIQLSEPLIGLTMEVQQTKAMQQHKQDLFAGAQGNLTPLELVSLLQAKLGKQNVHGIRLGDDHRPELANQLGEPLKRYGTQYNKLLQQPQPLRPSLLLPTPMPLTEKSHIVHGPERIVSGWWDGQAVMRDYFIARSEQGRWLWIYRTQQQQWFVHGFFS